MQKINFVFNVCMRARERLGVTQTQMEGTQQSVKHLVNKKNNKLKCTLLGLLE